jgi:hypothetical protein
MCFVVAAFFALIGLGVAAAQADTAWNLTNEFSTTSNPNGVWSYGRCSGHQAFSQATVFEDWGTGRGTAAGLGAWEPATGNYDPSVSYNATNASVTAFGFTWPAHTVALDAYSGAEYSNGGYADVRFTAPADGVYDLSFTYTDLAGKDTGARLWRQIPAAQGTKAQWVEATGGASGSYSETGITLSAGQTLDVLATGATVVQFDMTVSTVPEPGTLVLLASGLIGLAVYARRKRKLTVG